ncbi:hypothetical protein GGQ68_000013 [Sagittula marina]|uniref:Flagellar hook-length control protein-like C-terminal domain-containing protein n=1 Tax=Sagittula marina TaxID=943940 RepID=A0A7W6GQK3_9RHOB|nr:flagellar hook-length control protein FliK [Sagittula marina]MBB3983702.1 hypothetical protein [Sagittula marina]
MLNQLTSLLGLAPKMVEAHEKPTAKGDDFSDVFAETNVPSHQSKDAGAELERDPPPDNAVAEETNDKRDLGIADEVDASEDLDSDYPTETDLILDVALKDVNKSSLVSWKGDPESSTDRQYLKNSFQFLENVSKSTSDSDFKSTSPKERNTNHELLGANNILSRKDVTSLNNIPAQTSEAEKSWVSKDVKQSIGLALEGAERINRAATNIEEPKKTGLHGRDNVKDEAVVAISKSAETSVTDQRATGVFGKERRSIRPPIFSTSGLGAAPSSDTQKGPAGSGLSFPTDNEKYTASHAIASVASRQDPAMGKSVRGASEETASTLSVNVKMVSAEKEETSGHRHKSTHFMSGLGDQSISAISETHKEGVTQSKAEEMSLTFGKNEVPRFISRRAARELESKSLSSRVVGPASSVSPQPTSTSLGVTASGLSVAPIAQENLAKGAPLGQIDVEAEAEADLILEELSLGASTRRQVTSSAPHGILQNAPNRSEAAAVVRQIAEGAARVTDGTVELRLQPEELGRVRMFLVSGEHGLTVTILADRQETLDLMRRNVDELARNLSDAGFEGAGFSFGEDPGSDDDESTRSIRQDPREEPELNQKANISTQPVDGLDIRI